MGLVGVLYLLFEKNITASSADEEHPSMPIDNLSRGILGVQVGLIVLAMAVTKSSVTSLQARRGLPFGNQVVGWIILGEKRTTNMPIALFS